MIDPDIPMPPKVASADKEAQHAGRTVPERDSSKQVAIVVRNLPTDGLQVAQTSPVSMSTTSASDAINPLDGPAEPAVSGEKPSGAAFPASSTAQQVPDGSQRQTAVVPGSSCPEGRQGPEPTLDTAPSVHAATPPPGIPPVGDVVPVPVSPEEQARLLEERRMRVARRRRLQSIARRQELAAFSLSQEAASPAVPPGAKVAIDKQEVGVSVAIGVVDLRLAAPPPAVERERRPWWLVLLVVVASPTLIGLFYWACLASPMYVATAGFTVRSEGTASLGDSLASAIGMTVNGGTNEDTRTLLAYIPSLDLMQQLDPELKLREHYSDTTRDWFSRLGSKASQERFHDYWQRRVAIRLDDATGLVMLEVQAFDPAYARAVAQGVIAHSERYVNDLGLALVSDRKRYLEETLRVAQENLRKAKNQLLAFQDKNGIFDPLTEGGRIAGTVSTIQAELVKERVALAEMLTTQGPSSDGVRRQEARIKSLEEQAGNESARLLGPRATDSTKVNTLASEFQDLFTTVTFRTEAYKSVLASYELANAELDHRLKHLQVVVQPIQPEDARYPRLFYNTITLLGVMFGLWFVVTTAWKIMLEHRD